MVAVPSMYSSDLIQALRGGISDTGQASGVRLLANPSVNYGALPQRVGRAGSLLSPQILAMSATPRRERAPVEGSEASVLPPNYSSPSFVSLQKPEEEVATPDYTDDLWGPEPTTEPMYDYGWGESTQPYAVQQKTEPVVEDLPPVPTVGVVQDLPVSDAPAIQSDPMENFLMDQELGYIQQSDVPVAQPVAQPEPQYQEPVSTEPVQQPSIEPSYEDFGVWNDLGSFDYGTGGQDLGVWDDLGSFDYDGCPAPWVQILLEDKSTIAAGELKPGMKVWTQHEHTAKWGSYPITAVSIVDNNRTEVLFEDGRQFVGSDNHRVKTIDGWKEVQNLVPGDNIVQEEGFAVVSSVNELDAGPVVKITVQDAHTYVSEGFLSHNIKKESFGGYGGLGGGGGWDWRDLYNSIALF